MTSIRVLCLMLAAGVFLIVGQAHAQDSSPGFPQAPQSPDMPQVQQQSPFPGPPSDADPERARIVHEMEKKANEQRQQQLKKDTDQLLKLATELKAYVDKTNENVLSLDVMKKAEEIEKLAHSVRDKMKGSN